MTAFRSAAIEVCMSRLLESRSVRPVSLAHVVLAAFVTSTLAVSVLLLSS